MAAEDSRDGGELPGVRYDTRWVARVRTVAKT